MRARVGASLRTSASCSTPTASATPRSCWRASRKSRRDAEWYFLRGRVFYVRGWLDQAYNYYVRANQMSPGNAEYQTALNQLMWQRNTGRPAGGYGDYRNVQTGGASGCDMCMGLICADTCCECMGGDLISCC